MSTPAPRRLSAAAAGLVCAAVLGTAGASHADGAGPAPQRTQGAAQAGAKAAAASTEGATIAVTPSLKPSAVMFR